MDNSKIILRLLADLKMEHQKLNEELEKLQLKLTFFEEKNLNKKTIVTKQHQISEFPRSFHEWKTSNQKIKP
ncbi:preprotein translocase [Bacillus wiedmannii]|uniref:preprotein translocase n=1 Tax=Bacillus wiedmannii TaxID=1890302 RepID=UPI0021D28A43|nr:preprotein translocase [Bacillus wiedmannii]MCU5601417.1 preprotein translocase [Bacillus wiedmannii]